MFYLSNSNELRREDECASIKSGSGTVYMIECGEATKQDKWKYKNNRILHEKSGECLTVDFEFGYSKVKVNMKPCVSSPKQSWIFENFKRTRRYIG